MQYMLTLLGGRLPYVRTRAPQWKPGTTTHHHSHHDHQQFLASPFQEAMAAYHHKKHEHGIPNWWLNRQ
jgi:hypothetical protein